MSAVSFETAKRLKEAGFPQPDYEFGQLWYSEDERQQAFVGTGQMELLRQHYVGKMVFAPTATDILEQLGEYWTLRKRGAGNWIVAEQSHEERMVSHKIHASPHEAAALAWLNLNETKGEKKEQVEG